MQPNVTGSEANLQRLRNGESNSSAVCRSLADVLFDIHAYIVALAFAEGKGSQSFKNLALGRPPNKPATRAFRAVGRNLVSNELWPHGTRRMFYVSPVKDNPGAVSIESARGDAETRAYRGYGLAVRHAVGRGDFPS